MEDTNGIIRLQQSAQSYEEWLEASQELDKRLGFDNWKKNDRSLLYDFRLIRHRLTELQAARQSKNYTKVLYIIRTTLMRNLGNILSEQLYQNSYCGTKLLIEEYIKEVTDTIQELVSNEHLDSTLVMNTLLQTRKAFGRTALVLSGGATLGLLHAGVLFELEKQKLLPKIISGSSAGSIFAALVCTHKDDEFDELWPILDQDLQIFDRLKEEEGVLVRLKRFLISGTWIDNTYLSEMLQGMLGDVTFQEAYNRTGRILNVTVSSSGLHDMPRLLNYLTAPNVLVWSAVASSCSVPLIFASSNLMAKDPATGELYSWTKASFIDGSVDNDLPLDRLAEMFNVNHFIACQVNPHIAPMLRINEYWSVPKKAPESLKAGNDNTEYVPDDSHQSPRWFRWGKSFLFNEVTHSLDLLDQVGLMKNLTAKLANLMGQEYIGNVTIIPRIEFSDFFTLLKNPTPEIMHKALIRGRRAIWPKLAIIYNNCAIEMALDTAVHTLRSQVIGTALRSGLIRSSNKPRTLARRRSEDGNMRIPHHRWSSTDLTTSPARKLVRQSSNQSGKSGSITHSLSLNAHLNDLLQDRGIRLHKSANHSPALSRNDSFTSIYNSPITLAPPARYTSSVHQYGHQAQTSVTPTATDSFITKSYRKSSEPVLYDHTSYSSGGNSPGFGNLDESDHESDTETIKPEKSDGSISS